MSDFIYKCTSQKCDFITVKPETACPLCSSEVVIALRPLIVEEVETMEPDKDVNLEGIIDLLSWSEFRKAMKEEETAEATEAERRYWRQVEEDERNFDPLEDDMTTKDDKLRVIRLDADGFELFPY